MYDSIELFVNLLNERFLTRALTTEDSVRYTFFYAILSRGMHRHTDVILESPHPCIERAKIDTLVLARASQPSVALEFKYDRGNPGRKNQNRTQRAGAVFNDVFRLVHVPRTTAEAKYLVYLTDPEMAKYFRKPSNGLNGFFELHEGQLFAVTPEFIAERPKSFQEPLKASQVECTLIGLINREIAGEHSLRIYEVKER